MSFSKLRRRLELDDIRQENLYDAFRINGSHEGDATYPLSSYSTHIFGNANVGLLQLSNMQVAGCIPLYDDQVLVVQRWYARTNALMTPRFITWAQSVIATLQIRMRQKWQLSLAELFARRPNYTSDQQQRLFDPKPVVIRRHEDFGVRIDVFARDNIGAEMFTEQLRENPDNGTGIPVVWIHLEGVRTPGEFLESYLDDMFECMKLEDDRVARHILGFVTPTSSEEEKAQLQAIADSVLEQRHRQ